MDPFRWINTFSPNIQFTVDKQPDNALSYLDVLMSNTDHCISSLYHKTTDTGLPTNFFSFTIFSYKIDLKDRICKINEGYNRKGGETDLKELENSWKKVRTSFLFNSQTSNFLLKK